MPRFFLSFISGEVDSRYFLDLKSRIDYVARKEGVMMEE